MKDELILMVEFTFKTFFLGAFITFLLAVFLAPLFIVFNLFF